MKIYHYSGSNGAYLGEGEADPSPLEPGKFLLPANSTVTPPPKPGSGQRAVWRNKAWMVEPLPPVAGPMSIMARGPFQGYTAPFALPTTAPMKAFPPPVLPAIPPVLPQVLPLQNDSETVFALLKAPVQQAPNP